MSWEIWIVRVVCTPDGRSQAMERMSTCLPRLINLPSGRGTRFTIQCIPFPLYMRFKTQCISSTLYILVHISTLTMI